MSPRQHGEHSAVVAEDRPVTLSMRLCVVILTGTFVLGGAITLYASRFESLTQRFEALTNEVTQLRKTLELHVGTVITQNSACKPVSP